jgi:hypothetical protein
VYDGPERRRHCEIVIALKTAFEEDKRIKDEWRKEVNDKLEKILTFTQKIDGPYNAGLWALRILIGGLLAGFAALILKFFKDHIK